MDIHVRPVAEAQVTECLCLLFGLLFIARLTIAPGEHQALKVDADRSIVLGPEHMA